MSAQDVTLQQYYQWMKMNAAAHLLRSARQIGLFAELRQGQRTLTQLCESLSLQTDQANLLLDALVAIGIVEQYADDYALSRAAHLLCQYDQDLGDQRWSNVAELVLGDRTRKQNDDQQFFDYEAATQWTHTPAAIQAAEILDLGGDDQPEELAILDLGCGSAVWSCAMAHRDSAATVTAIDHPAALQAAQSTAESIELGDRFQTIESDPTETDLPDHEFDLVVLAQRLGGLDDQAAAKMLDKAASACKSGGRVVVIDPFRGPNKPDLAEAIEALRLNLQTQGGRMRSLDEIQQLMSAAGFAQIQFTFLAASQAKLGLAVGVK